VGLLRSIARDFPKVLEALNAIPAVTSDKAPAIFQTLSYASLETGDIPTARAHLATARKYQKSPEGNQALDKLEKLIEGRAKSQYAPKPGERLARTEGMLQGIDCSQPVQKMVIATAQGRLLLTLPAADALEVIHKGPGSLELKCGALPQTKIAVEYAPASTMRQDTGGVLRTLEF
jgi:hypothetical protein